MDLGKEKYFLLSFFFFNVSLIFPLDPNATLLLFKIQSQIPPPQSSSQILLTETEKNHQGRENLPAPVIMYFMKKILPAETIAT